MITKKRNSTSYVVTLNLSDEHDMMWLKQARIAMREANKALRKLSKTPKRIRLALRDPIEKKAIRNWVTGKERVAGYDWGGNVVNGIKNARQADVYVYDRFDR
jgi:hypothetical protein